MPPLVAWSAAAVSTVISKVFTLPLALLQLFLPFPLVFQLLRLPFTKMAALSLLLGATVQTGLRIEEVLVDKVGTVLDSALKSSKPKVAPLHTFFSALQEAEEQLDNLTTTAYPAALSSLLDKPLALPALAADSEIVFTADDIREWEEGSQYFRTTFEDLAAETAQNWVDTLTFDPAQLESPTFLADPAFLAAVKDELDLIQAGRPKRAIYSVEEYTEEQWAREEAEKKRLEEEEEAKLEAQFELFLDGMFEKAEELQKKKAEGDDATGEEAEDATAGGDLATPSTPLAPSSDAKRARALLEQPQDPSRPISPSNPTWRTTLRTQWDTMFNPRQGGVLGEAFGSLNRIFEDLGSDTNVEEDDKKEWRPKSIPLIANSLLRQHLQQAIALSSSRAGGFEQVWEVDHQAEETILPSILQGVPTEFLTFAQKAVKTDQRARAWATSLLSFVFSPPPPPSSPFVDTSSTRATAALLRSSPFPSFLRSFEALFALPMDKKAIRIGVSKHEMAFVVLANKGQMEANGKEGVVGAVAVEWARRRVDVDRKAAVEAEIREERKARGKEEL